MYRTPVVAALTGATFRQLDGWDRAGLISPSVKIASGSGAGGHRLYSDADVMAARAVVMLMDAGVALNTIGRLGVVDVLRNPWLDWAGYLIVTTATCQAVTDPWHVVDLIRVEGATVVVLPLRDVQFLTEPAHPVDHRTIPA